MIIDDKQINNISFVLGVSQDKIRKDMEDEEYKEFVSFSKSILKTMNEYVEKDKDFDISGFISKRISFLLTLTPKELRTAMMIKTLEVANNSEKDFLLFKKLDEENENKQ